MALTRINAMCFQNAVSPASMAVLIINLIVLIKCCFISMTDYYSVILFRNYQLNKQICDVKLKTTIIN